MFYSLSRLEIEIIFSSLGMEGGRSLDFNLENKPIF